MGKNCAYLNGNIELAFHRKIAALSIFQHPPQKQPRFQYSGEFINVIQ